MRRFLISALAISVFVIEAFGGVNRALNAAQQLFEDAETVEQYEAAKNKFLSATTDVGYVPAEHDNLINEGVKKCNKRINELSPRLSVNGNTSSTNISFSDSGGSKSLTISTNQGTPHASALPSWITVSSVSSTSMTIDCAANTSTSSRNDWFNVNAGAKTVRVNVTQSGKSEPSITAEIDSVWIEKDVYSDGQKGIYVHVNFSVGGLKGKDGLVMNFYYDSSDDAITDADGDDVVSLEYFKPNYDNSRYRDFKVFLPYADLRQSGTYQRVIKVVTCIIDRSSADYSILDARLKAFTFTPEVYLKVDNKTAVSASFAASGGSETFYISTNAGSWTTWGVPSWVSITEKTGTSFKIVCAANSSTSRRNDYMKIQAGDKEVRIDIAQEGQTRAVTIEKVWDEHNLLIGLVKGMKIHAKVRAVGYNGSKLHFYCYFYYGDNTTPLKATLFGGQVQAHVSGVANYDDTTWNDLTLTMYYTALNMAQGWSGKLSYDFVIKDSSGNVLAREDNNSFYYSQW